jgi:act minimal PKS ketosynthase (KS/KS alpha)
MLSCPIREVLPVSQPAVSRPDSARRVVITGTGVAAPGDPGCKPFWDLLSSGRSAVRAITLFDASGYRSRVAAECNLRPADCGISEQQARSWARATQLAVTAAREALEGSGLDGDGDALRTGVLVGTSCGLMGALDAEYAAASDQGRRWLVSEAQASPFLYDYLVPSSIAREVAWLAGAQGPAGVISSGCTSGIDVIGQAAAAITEGSADVMIAGAAEAPISPVNVACFDAIRATTARNDSPQTASRPFDRTRDGFVLGEGAAIMVLEELGHARRRGAPVLAEVAGYATRANAYHMTGLRETGAEMAAAIRAALAQARAEPSDVDYLNAHGTSTPQNDRHETAAYKESLGGHAYRVPVSSIKSMIGHALGAAGALEIAACVLAIGNSVIPPTANLRERDPECDLDYVPLTARERKLGLVLSVASGFGGFQSAIVLAGPGRRAA